jgi:hypothetical protein
VTDRPRLRPLEAFPLDEDGQKLLGLRDPSGLTDHVARLPPAAVAVVQLCDGESSRDQICAEFERRYRSPLPREALDRLLDQLDQALLLDSERFRLHSATVFAEFARAPVRAAHLAGKSYPADPGELAALLDSFYDPPRGPGRPGAPDGPLPRAIVAPHIDFHRGGAAYAWAYRPLAEAALAPEVIVVFGTDHNGADHPFTLTRKHFDTPLGRLTTDVALVDALTSAAREKLGPSAAENLFRDEHHHRGEHALEFQMIWLRHVLKERADGIKVLPILCGSLHHLVEDGRSPDTDAPLETLLAALETLTAGRRTLYIAGADLAHVGPRFGDPDPLDAADRDSLERRDQATLIPAARGDARGWFDEIAREKDRRRVCGLPPIYALLRAARPSSGKLAVYAQCPADDAGGSLVSIASLVYTA